MANPSVSGFDSNGAAVAKPVGELYNDGPSDDRHGFERLTLIDFDFNDIGANANVNIGPTFPDNAVIVGAHLDGITAFAGAGSIGLGFATDGATSIQASAPAAGAPWNGTVPVALTLSAVAVPGAYIKLTAARQVLVTRTVGTVTAGRAVLAIRWYQSV